MVDQNPNTYTDNAMENGVALCDTDVADENLEYLKYEVDNPAVIDVPQCVQRWNGSIGTSDSMFDISAANLTGNKIDAETQFTCRKDGKDKIYTLSEDIDLGTLVASTTYYVALEITNDTPVLTNADVTIHLLSEAMYWKQLTEKPQISKNDMTSDSDSGYITSASTVNGGNSAYKSFEGTNAVYWLGAGGGSDWLQQQFPVAKICTKYSVMADTSAPTTRSPKDWTLKGSNNGTDWTTLHTVTTETGWITGETRLFDFDNTTDYLYYRLDISANNGDATYTGTSELVLYELIQDSFYYDGINCFIGDEADFTDSSNAKRCIMFGKLTTDVTEVTDIITYAFNRKLKIENITAPTTGGLNILCDNILGFVFNPKNVITTAICRITEYGYNIGDEIVYSNASSASNPETSNLVSKSSISVIVGSSLMTGYTKTSGGYVGFTEANWKLKVEVDGGNF